MENDHSSKMLDKNQKLNKLYKELRDTERKLMDIQSVFNSGPGQTKTHTRNVSPFGMGSDQISRIYNRNVSYSPLSHMDNHQNKMALGINHQHTYS